MDLKLDPYLDIMTMAGYEATGLPIILKDGQKVYPTGWLRFLNITAEEVLDDKRQDTQGD